MISIKGVNKLSTIENDILQRFQLTIQSDIVKLQDVAKLALEKGFIMQMVIKHKDNNEVLFSKLNRFSRYYKYSLQNCCNNLECLLE